MDYKDYINSQALAYKKYLIDDLKNNLIFTDTINSLFFPSEYSIQKWLQDTEVKSFNDYRFKGNCITNRICTREEIDNIPLFGSILNKYDKNTFFSKLECDSYEIALKNFPTYYHFIQKDFFSKMDKIILDKLSEYKADDGNAHFYRKRITNSISLIMNFEREHIDPKNIIEYRFPLLLIDIKKVGYIRFGKIDVRSLLFLRSDSFVFFYLDSHDYTIDESLGIKDIKRKSDEPIIHYLEEKQKYIITNSYENIDRYNKYIHLVMELSFHYFGIFEEWLTKLIGNIAN